MQTVAFSPYNPLSLSLSLLKDNVTIEKTRVKISSFNLKIKKDL